MPDTPLILHHYDFSNYAEKARLALGYKGLAWRGVIIPPVAPKPDLTPFTGGYRRTPVLQIGADIFCDTRLILRELERRNPQPTLYPQALTALADMIAYWAEHQLFRPMSLYVSGTNADLLPRTCRPTARACAACRSRMPPRCSARPNATRRLCARSCRWIEALFADGRAWIAGDAVSVADFRRLPCALVHDGAQPTAGA